MQKNGFYKLVVVVFLITLITACGANGSVTKEKVLNNPSESVKTVKKQLTMGTSADFPPFEYVDLKNNNQIVGFDVDVAKYITSELGYDLQINDIGFDGLIPAISNQRVDFVLADMTVTEERKKNVDFSKIYYDSKHLVLFNSDKPLANENDLKGKIIGVQLGSVQEGQAKDLNKKGFDFQMKLLNKIPDLVQELKSHRLDGVIIEEIVGKSFLKTNKDLGSFEVTKSASGGSAIAFPKGSVLPEQFDKIITKMQENGKLNELANKWFSADTQNK